MQDVKYHIFSFLDTYDSKINEIDKLSNKYLIKINIIIMQIKLKDGIINIQYLKTLLRLNLIG